MKVIQVGTSYTVDFSIPAGHRQTFDRIYAKDLWNGGSGTGSTEETTRQYRAYLQQFLAANRIKSVIDVGCGDWQFSQYIDWSGVDYLGIDVSSVVLANTKKFTRPGVAFQEMDVTRNPLPSADLLVAKDVLQHWGNDDIIAFLPKLKSCRAALITNGFTEAAMAKLNRDIRTGNWRPIDLQQAPFNWPGSYVFWFIADAPKNVFLWQNPDPPAVVG